LKIIGHGNPDNNFESPCIIISGVDGNHNLKSDVCIQVIAGSKKASSRLVDSKKPLLCAIEFLNQ